MIKQIEKDINGNVRYQFNGTLVRPLSEKVFENVNGKKYRVSAVSFKTAKDEVKEVSCIVHEGNYNHLDVGEEGLVPGTEYLCTATITERDGKPSVIVTMSHLPANAPRAEAEDFGAEVAEFIAETQATAISS